MYYGVMDFDPKAPRLHLEMQPGDTVFFHPLLIHGSGMNRTSGFRKVRSVTVVFEIHKHGNHRNTLTLSDANTQAISTHYASSHCQYIDVSGSSQQLLAEEVQELAKKRLGDDTTIDFQVS